jgi:hypothetical protein
MTGIVTRPRSSPEKTSPPGPERETTASNGISTESPPAPAATLTVVARGEGVGELYGVGEDKEIRKRFFPKAGTKSAGLEIVGVVRSGHDETRGGEPLTKVGRGD